MIDDMSGPVPSSGHEDAHLVLQSLHGVEEAYGALVARHQRALYRQAIGFGVDHDTALDLVQDALVRAWERLRDCRNPRAFRAWVGRILRNLCLDHRKDRRRAQEPLDPLPEAEAPYADPRSLHDLPLELALRSAFARVPELLREAFLLKHDAGYSYDEIAEILGASPSAVKMRVHRARELLRDLLESEDRDVDSEVTTAWP